jgi:hypothetical protein
MGQANRDFVAAYSFGNEGLLRGVASKNVIFDWHWILRHAIHADHSARGGDLTSRTQMTPPKPIRDSSFLIFLDSTPRSAH